MNFDFGIVCLLKGGRKIRSTLKRRSCGRRRTVEAYAGGEAIRRPGAVRASRCERGEAPGGRRAAGFEHSRMCEWSTVEEEAGHEEAKKVTPGLIAGVANESKRVEPLGSVTIEKRYCESTGARRSAPVGSGRRAGCSCRTGPADLVLSGPTGRSFVIWV